MTKNRNLRTNGDLSLKITIGVFIWLSILLEPFMVIAQILPDRTLGREESVITPIAPTVDRIDGGAIRGGNLFHSFSEFNVNEGQSLYFYNPAGVENIFNRITGVNPSNILGTLGVLGSANLFLLNPNGLVFGANTQLDLRGSFLGTTADSFIFRNGFNFSSSNPELPPLLTVNIPIGLQWSNNLGSIIVEGSGLPPNRPIPEGVDTIEKFKEFAVQDALFERQFVSEPMGLRVEPERILALVGNTITLNGGLLKASGGRIELGSVGESAEVSISGNSTGFSLGYERVDNFQDIRISGESGIFASGNGGGDIYIVGRRITFNEASEIRSSTLGSEAGGILSVIASESIEAIDNSDWFVSVAPGATGDGGNVRIETERLILRDDAGISTATFGSGTSGSISVIATEVELIGTSTVGQFPSSLAASVSPGGTGNGGNLTLETRRLILRDGAFISAATFGEGKSGVVTLQAEDVELIGTSVDGIFPTGLFSSVERGATGDGGNLTIETQRLMVRNGAVVSTSTSGLGNAGSLTIIAAEVEVKGTSVNGFSSQLEASSASDFAAGDINIGTVRLSILDGATLSVSAEGLGSGGNLNISANTILLDNQASLRAEILDGNQGNIILNTDNLIMRRNSEIITNATGEATGGNITINTGNLVALQNSDISANAEQNFGGRIIINAEGVFGTQFRSDVLETPESDITATSAAGSQFSGSVELNIVNPTPSQGLLELTETLLDPNEAISQNPCEQTNNSEFYITGRGGLPPDPSQPFSGMSIFRDILSLRDIQGQIDGQIRTDSSRDTDSPLIEANRWKLDEQGKIVLIASFSTVTTSRLPLPTSTCKNQ